MKRLPNFVIAGTPKSGTTTLFDALASHPDVCGSSTKETAYFTSLIFGEPLAPLSTYYSYFRACSGESIVAEGTPNYFYGGSTVALALQEVCRPRVLIVLREPVSRLISDWKRMKWWMGIPDDLTLDHYVQECDRREQNGSRAKPGPYFAVRAGYYADFLSPWLELYSSQDLKIVFFDRLVLDQFSLLRDIATWLGIDPDGFSPANVQKNVTVGFRSRWLQTLSLRARKAVRPISSRHPRIARSLRSVYRVVNEAPTDGQVVSEGTLAVLHERYKEPNQRLAVQLNKAGISPLPDWLPST